MKDLQCLLLLSAFLSCVATRPWDALLVKWDLVPFSGGFDDATKWLGADGSAYVDNFCPQVTGGIHDKPFLYYEFVNPNATFVSPFVLSKSQTDKTITVLQDGQGNTAGLQNWIPAKSGFAPDPTGDEYGFYVQVRDKNTGDLWFVQTVYFQPPSSICKGLKFRDNSPIGFGLYFQNGPNPLTDFFHAPMTQSEVEADKMFYNTGKCFYTMGQHFWYNVHHDLPCKNFHPYCLLYNKGELNAFCFASNAFYSDPELDSPRPTTKVLSKFMADVPACMNPSNAPFSKFSTIHVFLSKHPKFNFC